MYMFDFYSKNPRVKLIHTQPNTLEKASFLVGYSLRSLYTKDTVTLKNKDNMTLSNKNNNCVISATALAVAYFSLPTVSFAQKFTFSCRPFTSSRKN